jgi:hypothetical protein
VQLAGFVRPGGSWNRWKRRRLRDRSDRRAGIGPAFTFMQASVGTCLPTLMMLPKLIGVKLTVTYLTFWLVYSIASGILVGWIL